MGLMKRLLRTQENLYGCQHELTGEIEMDRVPINRYMHPKSYITLLTCSVQKMFSW